MAKARDLAALAGLAGLAYAMRNKRDKDDAGDQKTSSYTGDTKKVEAKDEPRRQITDYMKKAPGDSKPITEADVVTPEKAAPAAPKKLASTTAKTNRNVDYSNEGRSSAKPPSTSSSSASRLDPGGRSPTLAAMEASKTARNVDYSNEGRSSAKPRVTPPVAVQSPAASTTPVNKFEYEMPITRFFKNVRETGNRGNPDAKMASGGMTASSRADGCAQRGKTRGKIC